MKTTLKVIKIGGNIIENEVLLQQFIDDILTINHPFIIVHGGGKTATRISKQLGNTPQMIEGRRITSSQDLEVVTMVYAGLINKKLVALLQSKNINAIGLSGVDANVILSNQRSSSPIDYGLVGDVKKVNSDFIYSLTQQKICPVFCAITHNGKGQLLNTNADTVASEIAIGMSSYYYTELIYCFEKKGVLTNVEDENSVITLINPTKYESLKANKTIHEGMLPKMENCFNALQKNVSKVIIGNTQVFKENQELFTTLTL